MIDLVVPRDMNWRNEVLSGLTVALALVPEAIAFAFVAGVDPSVGLWAAFFVGFITSLLGGRPGMISGATGAMAVVMTAFTVLYGLEFLFAAVILCGVIQIVSGLLGVAKFVHLLPHTVMLGFVNGLAIVIGLAQFKQLQSGHTVQFNPVTQGFDIVGQWISGVELLVTATIIAVTMAIIHFLPKFTKAVPGTLVAIVAVTLLVQFTPITSVTVNQSVDQMKVVAAEKVEKSRLFEIEKQSLAFSEIDSLGHAIAERRVDTTKAVNQNEASRIAGHFAIPAIPFTFGSLSIVFGLAVTLAAIGLIESLMTLTLIDELTESKGSGKREAIAQGTANIVSGLFGSMGGCAMIGQSMINIRSGGRHRLSGITAAIFLLAFILIPPLWNCIGLIPVASLIGVMFVVVIATFEWTTLRLWNKIPRSDMAVIVAVSSITVIFDLAIAVAAGVAISALVFACKSSQQIQVEIFEEGGAKTYELKGDLFFGAVTTFREIFTPQDDPDLVYIEFKMTRVCDHSALEAINVVCAKYRALKKTVILTNLSADCQTLINKAKPIMDVTIGEHDLHTPA
ncbi:MAG: sodium-independent anion transporter [Planctomycetaceae bacterium]|nr:sodium-independent anion transporter [Planctomycetaceae bacterium]